MTCGDGRRPKVGGSPREEVCVVLKLTSTLPGMAMAVAGMKMLNDKKARERAAEEAVEQTALESQKNKRWYRFW